MLNCDIRLPPQSTWVQIVIERIILRRVTAIPIAVIPIPWNYSFHSKFSISPVPNSSSRLLSFRIILFNFFLFHVIIDGLIRRIIARFDAQMAGSECKRRLEHARSLVFHEVAVRFPFLSRALSFSFARKITELLSEARFRSNLNLRSIEHTERIVVISSIAQPTFLATVWLIGSNRVGTVGVHAEDKLG